MTKSLIPLLLCLIFNLQLYAQTDNTVAIPEDCYDIIVPDTAAYIMFAMKKSDLKVHTFKTGECLWHTKYKPETYRIYAGNNGVFITKPTPLSLKRKNETRFLDYRNGKELHKYDVLPALIDEENDILIGYKGDNNNKLFGYKISSGEELWKTKIEKNYGDPWDLIVSSKSDSSIICLGNHIWKVNIYTGDRLEYKLKRRIHDKKTNAGLIGLNVLTVLFTGTFAYGPTYFDGFGSEPIIDDNGHIFAADRDAVVCLDYNLNEVWRYQLPEGIGSKSYLFLQGDTLRMINTGTAVTPDPGHGKSENHFLPPLTKIQAATSTFCDFLKNGIKQYSKIISIL